MKRNYFGAFFGIGLLLAVILSGCGMPSQLIYDKKTMDKDDVEEILESRLEMENPNMDLDVTIMQDGE